MNQSQKGALSATVIAIIVVLLASIGGGVYFLSKSGNLPVDIPITSQIVQRATEKDFEFVADPTMRKHFVAQANVSSYRTKTSSSGKGTKDTMEVQTKRGDFRWRTTVSDGKKDISDTIYIGDTTYLKDYKDGKWWKQTVKPEASENQTQGEDKPIDVKEEITKEKDKLTFKFLGKEPCDSLTCYKYQQSFGSDMGTQLVWFDDREYLSRKEEGSFGEFKTTIEYSYDNINVAPPSPTKDVPPGKNIYEYMYPEQNTGGSQYMPIKEDFNLPTFAPEENSDTSDY